MSDTTINIDMTALGEGLKRAAESLRTTDAKRVGKEIAKAARILRAGLMRPKTRRERRAGR